MLEVEEKLTTFWHNIHHNKLYPYTVQPVQLFCIVLHLQSSSPVQCYQHSPTLLYSATCTVQLSCTVSTLHCPVYSLTRSRTASASQETFFPSTSRSALPKTFATITSRCTVHICTVQLSTVLYFTVLYCTVLSITVL